MGGLYIEIKPFKQLMTTQAFENYMQSIFKMRFKVKTSGSSKLIHRNGTTGRIQCGKGYFFYSQPSLYAAVLLPVKS